MNKHLKAPLFDTLYEYSKLDTYSFDVPGHKMGLYSNRMSDLLGEAIKMDVNSMEELDLLYKPVSIIKEAQELMADAYGVDQSYFLVNGTTIGILAMISASIKPNEKILLPRNIHKSVISAIILTGAIPIFIEPELDNDLMIMNGISIEDIKAKYIEHPDLKAILLLVPTYFGILSDIRSILKFCKDNKIISLVDMAHGAHLRFFDQFKDIYSADLIAVSTHKTLGSMSQTSVLLHNYGLISYEEVMKALTLYQTTSASYLLMASLDETRRDIMINKLSLFNEVKEKVIKIRKEINKIDKISCIDESYLINEYRCELDPFKLTIKVNELGLSGFEVYKILKKEYNIQMELAETYTILAIISIADNDQTLQALIAALKDISKRYNKNEIFKVKMALHEKLEMKMSPKDAFHKNKKRVLINESLNKISGNSIMIYPPGIPICLPGEVIDQNVIDMLNFYQGQTIFTISENGEDYIEIVEE